MAITKRKGKALKEKKIKLPKGWHEYSDAVPLPFSRPASEFKHTKSRDIVQGLGEIIEDVGLGFVLAHLEVVCDEQAGLYGDGCLPVFPKDKHLAGVWAYFAKCFRDLYKFTEAYTPR